MTTTPAPATGHSAAPPRTGRRPIPPWYRRPARFALLAAALALGEPCLPRAMAGEWTIPREYRRRLSGGGKADTVVVSFCGGGHLAAGGSDIVVADEAGKPLPRRVLWSQRGEETVVAYDASKAQGNVAVYYGGGSGGGGSPGKWEPKLSLLLFTLPLPRGALASHKPIASAMRKGNIYGVGFVKNIWHGRNPYGPDDDFASAYIGYLKIEKAGRYKIYTASDEASFVLLDGKPLCSWPGRHEVHRGLAGQHSHSLHLDKGEYKIEYYHAELDGDQFMILGWTPPGQEGYHVVPESAFVHTPRAAADAPERRGGAPTAAFQWRQVDQLLHEKEQYTRVRFESQCRNVPPKARLAWGYGDGVTAEGRGGDHVYVGAGPFTCVLRIYGEDGKGIDRYGAIVRPVTPMENWTIQDHKPLREYVQAIVASDCSQVPERTMAALWTLVETQEDVGLVQPFVETYARRFGVKGSAWHAADRLALAWSLKDPKAAIKLYTQLAGSAPTKLDAARCQMERIELLLHKLKDPERALSLAEAVRTTRSGYEARIATVKIGDVHRAKGELEEAEKAYRQAQGVTYAHMDRRIVAVRQGGYLETAAAYVEHGELRAAREALVMWEIEHPIGKLSGDLILQTARYFDKLGDPERALAELDTITKINPLTPYLPEIELLMAHAYKKLGDYSAARKLYNKVLTEYPKSRAAREARREGL